MEHPQPAFNLLTEVGSSDTNQNPAFVDWYATEFTGITCRSDCSLRHL
jgi:hypothetical protein